MLSINVTWLFQVFRLIRIKHWIKNGFVFLPLFFSDQLFSQSAWLSTVLAFWLFSFCASTIYIVNDIYDVEKDRRHPIKKNRPIASGYFSVPQAWVLVGVLVSLTLFISLYVSTTTRLVVLGYFVLNVAYSTMLKHEVLLDVFLISIGFVLRVVAGAVAIYWYSPSWLILVTFFIALFLALGKRRHELLFVDEQSSALRPVLQHYNEKLLDYLIVISATMTIISYSLYVMLKGPYIYTLPFVIYGMFRYLHIVYTEDSGGDPTETVSKDKVIIANVGAWSLLVTGLVLFAN